jgi:hypothetical protein
MRQPFTAAAAILLAALAGSTQTSARQSPGATATPSYQTLVHVSATAGRAPTSDVEPSRFQFRADDAAVPANLVAVNAPASVAVVLDISGSMHDATPAQYLQAVVGALGTMDRDTVTPREYTIVAASGTSRMLCDFVPHPAGMLKNPVEIPFPYRTAILDACVVAADALSARPTPKHVIVLVTDGLDNASKTKLPQLRRTLLARNVLLYVVDVDTDPAKRKDPFDSYYQRDPVTFTNPIADLAGATGGALIPADGPEDLDAHFAAIGAELKSQYTFRLLLDDRAGDGPEKVRVRLADSAGSAGPKSVRVRYQSTFYRGA